MLEVSASASSTESFRSRCEAELKLALRTKERLVELLRSGPVEITREGQDRYRRTLATLPVREGDVGRILVRERLALPGRMGARRRSAGCAHGAAPGRDCQIDPPLYLTCHTGAVSTRIPAHLVAERPSGDRRRQWIRSQLPWLSPW